MRRNRRCAGAESRMKHRARGGAALERSLAPPQPATLAMRRSTVAAAAVWLALAVGCGRSDDRSPPQVAYGQTECEHCKMIVSDEPFAAAACVRGDDGVRKIAFDDVGCLLDYLKEKPDPAPVAMYVHDFKTLRWMPAAQATYVRSDKLQTPMASNLAACETLQAADALLAQYPGDVLTFDDLLRLKSGTASTSRSSP